MGTAAPLKQSEGKLELHTQEEHQANTRVYDLNQKTMQALDALAHEIFEETMKKVFAVACEVMGEGGPQITYITFTSCIG